MEGYDTTLMGSFFGYPAFRNKYGDYTGEEHGYQLSSPWQVGLNDIGAVGNIIGALLNGYYTPKYGHRKVMLVNLVFMIAFIFIVFFAPNLPCLLVGQFFCSIVWGVFTTMGPAYAAEVAPLALRGFLTAYVNLCWAVSFVDTPDGPLRQFKKKRNTSPYLTPCTLTNVFDGHRSDNCSRPPFSRGCWTAQMNGDTRFRSPCNGSGLFLSSSLAISAQSRRGTLCACKNGD